MKITTSLLALVAALGSTSTGAAEGPFPYAEPESVGLSGEKLKVVGDIIEEWVANGDVIGAELLIVKDDRTVYHEAFGWSDREARRPVLKDSIWSIKSMSKPFTAAAILMLSDAGKLSLDDRVTQYLPDFAGDKNSTLRDLLAHTTGWGGLGNTSGFETIGEWVADWGSEEPEGKPGQYRYSDFNYAALGHIVEAVSGMGVDRFIEERLVDPLGMADTHTAFSPDAPWAWRVPSRYRLAADQESYEKYWTNRDDQEWAFYPAAWGRWSTARDYARCLALWMEGGRYGDQRLLGKETVETALAPQSSSGPNAFYGYGWSGTVEPRTYGHGGFDGTLARVSPANAAMVILLTHSRGRAHREALMNRLGLLGIFEHPGFMARNLAIPDSSLVGVALTPDERSIYTGTYRQGRDEVPDRIFQVEEVNDRLRVTVGDLGESTTRVFELVPLGDHHFGTGQYRDQELEAVHPTRRVVFSMESGEISELRVLLGEELLATAPAVDPGLIRLAVAERLAERWKDANRVSYGVLLKARAERDPAVLEIFDQLAGRYQLSPDFVVEVRREGDELIAQGTGQAPVSLEALSPTRYVADRVGAEVEFIEDDRGRASAFILYQGGEETRATRLDD